MSKDSAGIVCAFLTCITYLLNEEFGLTLAVLGGFTHACWLLGRYAERWFMSNPADPQDGTKVRVDR